MVMKRVKFLKNVTGYDDFGSGRELREFKAGEIALVSDSFAIDMFNDGAVELALSPLPKETKPEESEEASEQEQSLPEDRETKVIQPKETKPVKSASKKKAVTYE